MPEKISQPASHEYPAGSQHYMKIAGDRGDLMKSLSDQIGEVAKTFSGLTATQASYRYEPDKWSVIEVLGHLNDVERILSTRMFRISRNDATPSTGFDHEAYVREARYTEASIPELVQEFEYLRSANIKTVKQLSESALDFRGIAKGNEVSCRASIFMLVGHVEHHMQILRARYLGTS